MKRIVEIKNTRVVFYTNINDSNLYGHPHDILLEYLEDNLDNHKRVIQINTDRSHEYLRKEVNHVDTIYINFEKEISNIVDSTTVYFKQDVYSHYPVSNALEHLKNNVSPYLTNSVSELNTRSLIEAFSNGQTELRREKFDAFEKVTAELNTKRETIQELSLQQKTLKESLKALDKDFSSNLRKIQKEVRDTVEAISMFTMYEFFTDTDRSGLVSLFLELEAGYYYAEDSGNKGGGKRLMFPFVMYIKVGTQYTANFPIAMKKRGELLNDTSVTYSHPHSYGSPNYMPDKRVERRLRSEKTSEHSPTVSNFCYGTWAADIGEYLSSFNYTAFLYNLSDFLTQYDSSDPLSGIKGLSHPKWKDHYTVGMTEIPD